ncbi:swsn-3 [Pristionchus pacificus]|uniref:Swsn-3 n=1 Tax=Pristionchus pacificus TaxID=54126 RepID=A0A454XPD2_PRIPA|nr:swsn-3 [Pristionchus pacificus]|eukprot:PDM67970.1 swsn-3 [Pristionchus pacificus]
MPRQIQDIKDFLLKALQKGRQVRHHQEEQGERQVQAIGMFAQGQMKLPKAPDRPLVPYMRYSRKMWAKVRAENPDAQLWDISKIIGSMWKDVSEMEKHTYNQEYEIEKMEYEKAMKNFHNSNSYQQYQQQQKGGKAPQKMSRGRMDVGGVVIQPIEDDADNNELSARRVSAIRFDRNHRLITELLSTNIVNDTRTIVAQSRIELLKKQADSLIMHQKKLEKELTDMGEKFNEKKRGLETSSEEFADNLKKVCDEKVVVEPTKYEEMVEEWRGKLADAYDDYKTKVEDMEKKLASEREKMAEKTPVLYNLTIGEDEEKEKKKINVEKKKEVAKVEVKKENGSKEEEKMEVDEKINEDGIVAKKEEESTA